MFLIVLLANHVSDFRNYDDIPKDTLNVIINDRDFKIDSWEFNDRSGIEYKIGTIFLEENIMHEGTPILYNGANTFYRIFLPKDREIKAVIFHIYGGGEKSKYYQGKSIFRLLAHNGIAIVQLRLRDEVSQEIKMPKNELFFYTKEDVKEHPLALKDTDVGKPKSQIIYNENEHQMLFEEIVNFVKNLKNIKTDSQEMNEKLANLSDKEKFLTGHSYGGLLTAKFMTDPTYNNTFAGYIPMATMTYRFKHDVKPKKLEGELEPNWFDATYSSILRTNAIDKPVLMIHNARDSHVKIDSTFAFLDHAKKQGKNIRFFGFTSYRHDLPTRSIDINALAGQIYQFIEDTISGTFHEPQSKNLRDSIEKMRRTKIEKSDRFNDPYPMEAGAERYYYQDTLSPTMDKILRSLVQIYDVQKKEAKNILSENLDESNIAWEQIYKPELLKIIWVAYGKLFANKAIENILNSFSIDFKVSDHRWLLAQLPEKINIRQLLPFFNPRNVDINQLFYLAFKQDKMELFWGMMQYFNYENVNIENIKESFPKIESWISSLKNGEKIEDKKEFLKFLEGSDPHSNREYISMPNTELFYAEHASELEQLLADELGIPKISEIDTLKDVFKEYIKTQYLPIEAQRKEAIKQIWRPYLLKNRA